MNPSAVARRMALCCRQLAAHGLIAGRDGNLSVRVGPQRVLVTPSGHIKSLLTAGDMVEVDLAGKPRSRGRRKPTSELDLHLRILRHRPDIQAVVHAHPPPPPALLLRDKRFRPICCRSLSSWLDRSRWCPTGSQARRSWETGSCRSLTTRSVTRCCSPTTVP